MAIRPHQTHQNRTSQRAAGSRDEGIRQVEGNAYAPAAGRLAAAIATIWAKRRPIRDGAPRRNERTCCISSSSIGPVGTVVPTTGRTMENGPDRLTSRDVSENSNGRIVRTPSAVELLPRWTQGR